MFTTAPQRRALRGIALILNLFLIFGHFATEVAWAQIVVDHNTATTLSVDGNVTDVRTGTVVDSSGINSFSQFHVGLDSTVNLHLPTGTTSLVNLVHGSQSQIHGLLNAIQADGVIGGDVYFLNPHGVIVGEHGAINVGSLTLLTPTQNYMSGFFTSAGNVDGDAWAKLHSGQVPISASGSITVQGNIHALRDIALASGNVTNEGLITSGAVFEAQAADFSDVVNTAGVQGGTGISIENGDIVIVAQGSVINAGTIATDGAPGVGGAPDLDAGSITIRAGDSVRLNEDSLLSAVGNAPNAADGNVEIRALREHSPQLLDANAATEIVVGGEIRAGNILLSAQSVADHSWSVDDEHDVFQTTVQTLGSAFLGVNVNVVRARAESKVVLEGSAVLDASGTVDLSADSEASSGMFSLAAGQRVASVGFVYGETNARAAVDVRDGARITASDLSLLARNTADLDVSVYAVSTADTYDSAVAVTLANVASSATIAQGAFIDLTGDLSIHAENENSFYTNATVMAIGQGKVGIAATVVDVDTSAVATNAADLSGVGNVTIRARDLTARNSARASSTVGSNMLLRGVGTAAGAAVGFVQERMGRTLDARSGATEQPKIAGAVTVALTDHSAIANIGALADVDAEGTVSIAAEVRDERVENHAVTSVESGAATATDPNATVAVSAAVGYGSYSHNAEAFVGEGASIGARNFDLRSDVVIPYEITYHKWEGLPSIYNKINGNLGAADGLLTGFANATGSADTLGLAGSVSYLDFDNTSRAYLDRGVSLTIRPDSGAGNSVVRIRANTDIAGVFGAGNLNATMAAIGGGQGAVALGGAYGHIHYSNVTQAFIAAGASVTADSSPDRVDISTEALSRSQLFLIAPTAGRGASYGLGGNFALGVFDNVTEASIDRRASINAGRVHLRAEDDILSFVIAGTFMMADTVSVGAGIAFQDVNTRTRAFIGDNTPGGDAFGPGAIHVEELAVDARTDGVIETISVAGTVTSSSDPATNAGATSGTAASLDGAVAQGEGVTGEGAGGTAPSFGLGISGSASVNTVSLTTDAMIDRSVVTFAPSGAGKLSVVAVNDTHIGAFSGAMAMVRANVSTSGLSVALAGSLALNDIDTATRAHISGATVEDVRDVAIYALASGEQLAIALGMAINASADSQAAASIAGSVSINRAANTLEAEVVDSTLSGRSAGAGDVDLTAYNRLLLGTGGGSLVLGGRAGIGAAITHSEIHNRTGARVSGSTLGGPAAPFRHIHIQGYSASQIAAAAAMGAVASAEGGSSLGGAFVISEIENETLAIVEDAALNATGDVAVDARDGGRVAALDALIDLKGCTVDCDEREALFDYDGAALREDGSTPTTGSSILSVAGVVQAGRENLGISLTVNTIRNAFHATVRESALQVDGELNVLADSGAELSGWSVGVGMSEGFSGAGSVTLNTIRNEVVAELDTSGGHAISVNGARIEARDRSHILSVAGQVIIGKNAGVGGAVALNDIQNTLGARVTGYELDVSGSTDVRALQTATIDTFAVSGGAADNALIGSVAISEIRNTTVAELAGAHAANPNNVISILADNTGRIHTLSGGAAFAGTAGVGAAASVNRIGNVTRARVQGTPTGQRLDVADLLVRAQSLAQIESMAVGLGVGGGVGVAGSTATNFIDSDTEAFIAGGAQVLAQGNVGVLAESHDVITNAAGAAGIGFEAAGVSGSVAINEIGGRTRAYIADDDTSVTALALLPNRSVRVILGGLTEEIDLAKFIDMEAFDPTSSWRPLVPTLQQTEEVRGVAVNATATHSIVAMAANVAAGAGAGMGGTASVSIVKGATEAYVDRARINDIAGASDAQQLVILASDHAYSHGLIGSIGIGGGLGIGAAANTNVFTRNVRASLTDSSAANGRNRVVVDAQATGGVSGITIGAAGGAAAAVGTANVALFSGDTVARVRGADITTGGLQVGAHQSNRLFFATPAAAIAAGAGFAGTASVVSMTGATKALLEDSDVAADGAVSVAATSESEIDAWSIGVAASGGFSVAGNVVVNVIERTTQSRVRGVAIGAANQRAGGLFVTATDHVSARNRAGAVGISLSGGGVGAGAVVTSIANDTSATVDHTHAFVSEDVRVSAEATRDVSTTAASAGVGAAAGIGGVAAVTLVGEHLSGDLLAELDVDGEGTLSVVESATNENRLVADEGDGEGQVETGHALSQAELASLNAEGRTSVRGAVTSSSSPRGTSAQIGANTVLDAGRDVTVRAQERIAFGMTAGAIAGSLGFSAGGSVGVTHATLDVSASLHGDSIVNAGRHVSVSADAAGLRGNRPALGIQSFQGSAGIATLGAAVAEARLTSDVTAVVGAGASVVAEQGDVTVAAMDHTDVRARAEGYVGGLAAAGVVLSDAVKTGTTKARIGSQDSATPPTTVRSQEGDIAVTALRLGSIDAFGRSGAGGVVAGAGVDVHARDESGTKALVGRGVQLTAQGLSGGTVQIDGEAQLEVAATAEGYGGGLFANVGFARAVATARPTLEASIGEQSTVDAARLDVRAFVGTAADRTMATSDAEAVGVGALGFSGNATRSEAHTDVNVAARIGATLQIAQSMSVLASYAASQRAYVSGIVAGLAAAGGNYAAANHRSQTEAVLSTTASGVVGGDLAIGSVGRSDSYASATSGSGGIVSGAAAQANTSNQTATRTEIGAPDLLRAGTLSVGASHTTLFNGRVSSVNASVAGRSGATSDHTVDSAVDVVIRAGSSLSTNRLAVTAFNESRKAELAGGAFNAQAGSGGIVDSSAVASRSVIEHHTDVRVGTGSDIIVTGDWDNPGQADFSAVNEIFVRDKTKLDAGGALEIARAESRARIEQARAHVSIEDDVTMDVAGMLRAAARSGIDVRTSANAKTYGGAGSAAGVSTAHISTVNTISIGNRADLRADGDIVLLAGQDLGGQLNTLSAVARTDLFNKTAIPVRTSPRADASITYENWIDIGSAALVRSVGDISLLAQRGAVNADGKGTGKDLYREILNALTGAFGSLLGMGSLSLSLSGGSSSTQGTTHVNVDGLVHAGIQNKQRLIFDTYGDVIEQSEDGITFTISEENLAMNLQERLLNLYDLRAAYHADPDAYGAFTAEINLIRAELRDLGFIVMDEDESGELIETGSLVEDLAVRHIVIDDVLARGGDITVVADHLGGQGSLRAPYDTEIVVHNPSNMFLRTNRMLIEDRGGHLYFNEVAVSGSAEINDLNIGNRPAANLEVEAAGSSDVTPAIDIRVTGNPNLLGGSGPVPEIEITGDLVNLARGGTLDIYNQYGSIVLRGEGDQPAPGVRAEVIRLDAGRNIVQAYRDGFVFIGADPKIQWDGETSNSNTVREGTGSYIAGNAVFLSARYLLINGLIQSGIPDWSIDLSEALEAQATALWLRWWLNGRPSIASAADLQNYVLAQNERFTAYFNPETQQIILDDVNVQGGYVELYGEILNTGGGKIAAMDGFGQITVNNELPYDLVVGTLDTGNIAGIVRITDTARRDIATDLPLTTVFQHLNGNVVREEWAGDALRSTTSFAGRTSQYNPLQGLRYEWVNGRQFVHEYEGYHSSTAWFEFIPAGSHHYDTWTLRAEGEEQLLPGGEYTRVGGGALFQYAERSFELSDWTRVYHHSTSKCNSFSIFGACIGPRTHRTWDRWTQGIMEVYTRSLRADYPIPVEFIGYDAGDARAVITVNSTGNVFLTNRVENLGGNISITTDGSILQLSDHAFVQSVGHTQLIAEGSIGTDMTAVQVQQPGSSSFSAVATNGDIHLRNPVGGLALSKVHAGGNVSIEAFGDIVQLEGAVGSVVVGEGVHLQSHTGAIGAADQALDVTVGSTVGAGLRASAVRDISIRQTEGDLRLFRVESLAGNVTLEVQDGAMVDVNTDEVRDERAIAELERLWDEMLLMGAGAEQSAEQTVEAFANQRQAEFQQYWALRNVSPEVNDDGIIIGYSADPYDPAQADAEMQRLHELFGHTQYEPTWTYQVTAEERAALTEGAEWTEDQLRLSLGQGILFKETGSTETEIRTPNVIGRNVTLLARSGSIGMDSDEIVIDTNIPDVLKHNEAARIALAAAEEDDIGVDNETGIITVLQRRAVNVQVQDGGELVAEAQDHAYIGSRSPLYVKTVEVGDSIRIRGTDGLYSVATTGPANVHGGRVILEGGVGGIGTVENPLLIGLTSNEGLTARAEGAIFLQETLGNLYAAEIFSRGLVDLHAFGSIVDVRGNRPIAIQGHGLNLYAGGDIGTASNPLLFTMAPDGRLDSEAAANIVMESTGTATLGQFVLRDDFGVLRMTAGADLRMLDEIRTPHAAIHLTTGGSLTQTGAGQIIGNNLTTLSYGAQDLGGSNRVLVFTGANRGDGDIRLTNDQLSLDVYEVEQAAGGDISITNSGSIALWGEVATTGEVNLVSTHSSIRTAIGGRVSGAALLATQSVGGLSMFVELGQNHTVARFTAVNAGGGAIEFSNEGTLQIEDVQQTAGGDIEIANSGDVRLTGAMATGDTVTLTATGSLTQSGAGRVVGAALLDTQSAGGQTLWGDNNVALFTASNAGGDIRFRNTGLLTLLDVVQTDDAHIEIDNDGDVLMLGTIETGDSVTLIAAGTLTQDGAGRVARAALTTQSLGGQTLLGDNTMATFTALNQSAGDIRLHNTQDGLTLAGVRQGGLGSIFVDNVGDIRVQQVVATQGDTYIEATGSIVNGNVGTQAVAESSVDTINLTLAATGGIGTPDHYLMVDSSNAQDGVVRAHAADGIFLWEVDGDLRVEEIVSAQGDIGLVAEGSVFNRGTAQAILRGATIDVRALGGTIGEAQRRLTVTPSEAFNAIAWGDLFIGVPVGDLVSDHLESEHGRIDLYVEGGELDLHTLRSPVGVSLRSSSVRIANLVHTGTNPLRLDVSDLNGLAKYVHIAGQSGAGVIFDDLGTEEAYIDIATDALALLRTRIERRGEFRNHGGFVIAENVVMDLFDADLQIYPRHHPFYLIMGADRSILTDALIVNYNDDYIINHFHTENSGVRATEKMPGVVSDPLTASLPLASGVLVPSTWWHDPVDDVGTDDGSAEGTSPADQTEDDAEGTDPADGETHEDAETTVAGAQALWDLAHIETSGTFAVGEGG